MRSARQSSSFSGSTLAEAGIDKSCRAGAQSRSKRRCCNSTKLPFCIKPLAVAGFAVGLARVRRDAPQIGRENGQNDRFGTRYGIGSAAITAAKVAEMLGFRTE
jgi:hypothetical protein